MKFIRVKEKEFKLFIETKTITSIFAQESNGKSGKFSVFGIDENNQQGYVIRYGCADELRTWKIEELSIVAKSFGFSSIKICFAKLE
ncbi:hypothetical protein [Aliivibrio fischeri]|uniref:Uncharacterized protein n=1 Tax=Aliivibrio fischeri TaxID=668 RepID=A0A510UN45_ALIFS|nr:hypothetical protein [Aliivibrio fischeri]GEK16093.1 hypothetical protein AFI02nite_41290 [Aliivibrio fischeri]